LIKFADVVEGRARLEHFQRGNRALLELAPQTEQLLLLHNAMQREREIMDCEIAAQIFKKHWQ
jgi:hypothetical protein